MQTILFAILLIGFCFIGLGVGVLFFGKVARRDECSSVPDAAHEDCPSQKAGLCPIEDTTGTLKLAKQARISY